MKPRLRRTGTLLALAVLLAFISTGSISLCDAILFGEPEPVGPAIDITVQAGETAENFAEAGGPYLLFNVCPAGSLPSGAYVRVNRSLSEEIAFTGFDLVTSLDTPPGEYTAIYVRTEFNFLSPDFVSGTFNLTVLPAETTLAACFYAYSEGEINRVNQPISFYAYCSLAPEANPIVQYKWWWNYNGNPSSSPDQTVTSTPVDHTYSTAGTKTVRLVVRAQNGDESAVTETVTVTGGI
jgi:hypothetical protein